MGRIGMLINYDYCTGCHSCEVACRVEHGFADGQGGIIVNQIGPWEYETDCYQYTFIPTPTDQCDLCHVRAEKGKDPVCVHHCQAAVMQCGDIDSLLPAAGEGSRYVIYLSQPGA